MSGPAFSLAVAYYRSSGNCSSACPMQLPVCGDSEVEAVHRRTSVSDLQIAAADDTARHRLSANHDLHRKSSAYHIR